MRNSEVYYLPSQHVAGEQQVAELTEKESLQHLREVVDRFKRFQARAEVIDADYTHPEINGLLPESQLLVQVWRHRPDIVDSTGENLHRHLLAVGDMHTGEVVAAELQDVQEGPYKDYSQLSGVVEVGGREFRLQATSESITMLVEVFEDEPKKLNHEYIWRNGKFYRPEPVNDLMGLDHALQGVANYPQPDQPTAS